MQTFHLRHPQFPGLGLLSLFSYTGWGQRGEVRAGVPTWLASPSPSTVPSVITSGPLHCCLLARALFPLLCASAIPWCSSYRSLNVTSLESPSPTPAARSQNPVNSQEALITCAQCIQAFAGFLPVPSAARNFPESRNEASLVTGPSTASDTQ